MDLRYQEVVENLAMIADNPWALPAYSSIFSGTTDVNDSIQVSSQTTWSRVLTKPSGSVTTFGTETLDIPASRAVKENWSLDPTIVPEKVRAMRAACWWMLYGPERVGEDGKWLGKYAANMSPGCYFDVAKRLAWIKPGWIKISCKTRAPARACYSATCRDTTVWVMPEDMQYLSEFLLVIQSIARMNMDASYYPHTKNRTVTWKNTSDTASIKKALNDIHATDVTMFLDDKGRPAPSEKDPVIPIKKRVDNIGTNSELKSVINASAKSN
jgi:hypothetical protein